MDKITKSLALSVTKADAEADIAIINQYAVKELTVDEVFCCNVILCDNEVDRDFERFTSETLIGLSKLMLGKTGISDHKWSAENQIARIYRCDVQNTGKKTQLGDDLKQLVASVYIPRIESTKAMIDAIETGIVKEVSIGCAVKSSECSICHTPIEWNPKKWAVDCANGHEPGKTYDNKLCVRELTDAADGYEFSFVAVPAQRGAGVTKSARDINEAAATLLKTDLSEYKSLAVNLIKHCYSAMENIEEKALRRAILSENEKFLRKE